MIELTALNALQPRQFVQALSGIFEHSPWIAQRAAALRPFVSRLDLLDAMRRIVLEASPDEQLALIHAHPRLGARGRSRQQLTQASSTEQRRAGLDACSDQEFAHLERINASYLARFGFPFILAVRGHDPASIIAQLERRLGHDRAQEIATAVQQIGLIASYRLADTVASAPQKEVRAMLERLPGIDAASLLREWMLAASLSVSQTDASTLVGTLVCAPPAEGTLIIGVHCNANTGSLSYDGQLGCACAIAVVQQLKSEASRLAFDVAILARPADPTRGYVRALTGLDARCTRPLSRIDQLLPESQPMAGALARAQLLRGIVAVVPEGAAQTELETETETELTLARATGALQEFLLHTDCHG
ncbi:MAG TPA: 2-oxo-4-hydroxy-4-carboxy-5-ureidoimidazoline decarboxylase [Steroidobacteraceae bacterium]|nr:2-oxo-4-hydroxy-4-carboxy-5-ureidoimidazoline decarboxylase [Steroidobacteraceae bacterium]